VGTDPWADDRWESEPELSQIPLPISLINSFGVRNPDEVVLTVPSKEGRDAQNPAFIFPVDNTAWKNWEAEYSSPDPVFSCRQMELVVLATIKLPHFECKGTVLVDTGCRIPLLFRKGLIPAKWLETARRPIKITTADGTPMVGGSHGCMMQVTLPVARLDGSPTRDLVCNPYWGYEAAVQGCDLVVGYPYLKIFKLVVDCPSDMLKSIPTSTSRFSTSPSTTTCSSASLCPHTPTSKSSTLDPDTGAVRNPTGSAGPGWESSPPCDSPGFKAKAARPKFNGELSSHPVLRQPRPFTGCSTVERPAAPRQLLQKSQPLPGTAHSAC